jgi:hypothetical protein
MDIPLLDAAIGLSAITHHVNPNGSVQIVDGVQLTTQELERTI